MTTQRIEIHKFGGTSVANADRILSAARLISDRTSDARTVVVSSATGGTTDLLVKIGELATTGEMVEVRALIDLVAQRHLEILRGLGGEGQAPVQRDIEALLEIVGRLTGAVAIHMELTPRVRDRILATGEKLAVRLFAFALQKQGLTANACDADLFLDTDARFGQANALQDTYRSSTRSFLESELEQNAVPVVTGFCGRAPDGATTTLGRGGSDLSATLIGAAIDADEVIIWTDVDGVLSANPQVVPDARVIGQLNYREAAELSFYGAKVLHQRTMIPVAGQGIPIWTKNAQNPAAQGTLVDDRVTPGSYPVKAVSAVRDHALISIEGKGMAGVSGFSARLFGAIARREISVTMYSQSSSEASICLALPSEHVELASEAIKEEFALESIRGEVEEISVKTGVGMVAVVGLGMARTPGVAGRAAGAMGKEQINILAIAQGSSELNITMAVEDADVDRALRALHASFGLHRADTGALTPDSLDLILFGAGKVGRTLAELVTERREHVQERFSLTPRVVALADTSGYILRSQGFETKHLFEILERKKSGVAIAEQSGGVRGRGRDVVRAALGYRLNRPILVDTSDGDDSAQAFIDAMRQGCDVVTANKKPLAGDFDEFRRVFAAVSQQGRVLKAEATVGAGLPVIDTLEILVGSGDRLRSAEGSLSGTLGFIMGRLEAGAKFSDAVAEAHEKGFTEPDPAVDLSGVDVARKAVILGRLSGLIDADAHIELKGLVEDDISGLPFSDLQMKLRELDAAMTQRVEAARGEGKVMRYLAQIERGRIVVGPRAVPADSPAGRLGGTENLIAFHSERYDTIPLVITGPGAGVGVTAMGVFGDILRVAAERVGA